MLIDWAEVLDSGGLKTSPQMDNGRVAQGRIRGRAVQKQTPFPGWFTVSMCCRGGAASWPLTPEAFSSYKTIFWLLPIILLDFSSPIYGMLVNAVVVSHWVKHFGPTPMGKTLYTIKLNWIASCLPFWKPFFPELPLMLLLVLMLKLVFVPLF